jgi:hypothetical protein
MKEAPTGDALCQFYSVFNRCLIRGLKIGLNFSPIPLILLILSKFGSFLSLWVERGLADLQQPRALFDPGDDLRQLRQKPELQGTIGSVANAQPDD